MANSTLISRTFLAVLASISMLLVGCVSTQSNFAKITHIPNLEKAGDLDAHVSLNTNMLLATDVAFALTDYLYVGGSAGIGGTKGSAGLFSVIYSEDLEKDFRGYFALRKIKDVKFGLRFDIGTRISSVYRKDEDYDITRNRKFNMFGITPSYSFDTKKNELTFGAMLKFEKTKIDDFSYTNSWFVRKEYPEFTTDNQVDLFFMLKHKYKSGWAINFSMAYLFAGNDSAGWDIIGGSLLFNNTQRYRFQLGVSKKFTLSKE